MAHRRGRKTREELEWGGPEEEGTKKEQANSSIKVQANSSNEKQTNRDKDEPESGNCACTTLQGIGPTHGQEALCSVCYSTEEEKICKKKKRTQSIRTNQPRKKRTKVATKKDTGQKNHAQKGKPPVARSEHKSRARKEQKLWQKKK